MGFFGGGFGAHSLNSLGRHFTIFFSPNHEWSWPRFIGASYGDQEEAPNQGEKESSQGLQEECESFQGRNQEAKGKAVPGT
jgi:hypothetical protein